MKNSYRQCRTEEEVLPYVAVFIRNKESKCYHQIRSTEKHAVWITPQYECRNRITFKELFIKFEFENDNPCGVLDPMRREQMKPKQIDKNNKKEVRDHMGIQKAIDFLENQKTLIMEISGNLRKAPNINHECSNRGILKDLENICCRIEHVIEHYKGIERLIQQCSSWYEEQKLRGKYIDEK